MEVEVVKVETVWKERVKETESETYVSQVICKLLVLWFKISKQRRVNEHNIGYNVLSFKSFLLLTR